MSSEAVETLAARLPNGRSPLPGVITAGQPDAAEMAHLAESGVKLVIDLRAPAEQRGFDEQAAVKAAGMTYRNIPVTPAALGSSEFDEFRKLLRDKEQKPVLVHCGTANRVGALLIPYLMVDEKRSRDEALQIAKQVGLRSDDLTRAALAYVAEIEPTAGG